MIKITIIANDDKVADEISFKETTLIENALVLRRLEEFKLQLLEREYEDDFRTEEDL